MTKKVRIEWQIFLLLAILLSSCVPSNLTNLPPTQSNQIVTVLLPTPTVPLPEPTFTPITSLETHYGDVRAHTRVDEIVADLKDLPVNDFFEESFRYWLMRDPEKVTALGLASQFNMRNNRLTDISEEYILETERLEREILDLLHLYNPETMALQDQLNYDIYEWFWQDRIEGQYFRKYDYLIHSYQNESMQDQLVSLFTDHQPLNNRQDIEDYISRLYQIKPKIEQLIINLKMREEAGIMPPRIILSDAINQTRSFLYMIGPDRYRIEKIDIYRVFVEKTDEIQSISENEKLAYQKQVYGVVERSFIPAYQELVDYLVELMEKSNDDIGIWKFDDGYAYYQYLLKHNASINITPEQVISYGEIQLQSETDEFRALAFQDGLADNKAELAEIVQQFQNNVQTISIEETSEGQYLISEWQKILNSKKSLLFTVFPETQTDTASFLDTSSYDSEMIKLLKENKDPWFDYFGSFSGKQYVFPDSAISTLLFAELYPGLEYKQNVAKNQEQPLFRKVIRFPGLDAGWSLYAPYVLSTAGVYQNDTHGDMQRLHREMFLSASMLVDCKIHYRGWSYGESANYLEDSAGLKRNSMRDKLDRYIVLPGQVSAYGIGFLKLVEFQQYAQDEIGAGFNLLDYHTWLLDLGNIPLEVLQHQVEDYVIQQKKLLNPNAQP